MAFTEQAWENAQGYFRGSLGLAAQNGYTQSIIDVMSLQTASIEKLKALNEVLETLGEPGAEIIALTETDTAKNVLFKEVPEEAFRSISPAQAIALTRTNLAVERQIIISGLVEPTKFAQDFFAGRKRINRDPQGRLTCPHWDLSTAMGRLRRANQQQKLPVARAS